MFLFSDLPLDLRNWLAIDMVSNEYTPMMYICSDNRCIKIAFACDLFNFFVLQKTQFVPVQFTQRAI